MRRLRHSGAVALAGAALVALTGLAQQSTGPRELLPDSVPSAPAAPVAPPPQPSEPVADAPVVTTDAGPSDDVAAETAAPSAFDLPAATGRSIDVAGPLTVARGGYGVAAFQGSDGVFVAGLLHRVQAPLASRWAHIVLRRALLSESAAPVGLPPADWIAWRAAVLLRMGEADGAVMLVDAVPVDRFTPLLYKVAGQAHLAAADIAGLCPLAQTGTAVSQDPLWRLATGMCGAMAGDDLTAAGTFDALRGSRVVDNFDVRLGQRVATLSGGAGRVPNLEWEVAPVLTPYRFGVALASGARIPADRLAGLGPVRAGWVLRAPGVDDAARAAAVAPAAALGIASARELVSTLSATAVDTGGLKSSGAGDLRAAFAAASIGDRYAAMKRLRDASTDPLVHYAALLQTGVAAARLPVDTAHADDAPDVVAALLAAGDEARAAAWWRAVQGDDTAQARVWALLAGGGGVPVSPDRFAAWRKADGDDHRARLLLAGLDGLGRTGGDWTEAHRDLALSPASNSWSRALAAAAGGGRTGEVAVLAATGLQCGWRAVPPAQFGAIVAAYVRVGLRQEARLLVAEAVTRG